jgi:hypothetical protein
VSDRLVLYDWNTEALPFICVSDCNIERCLGHPNTLSRNADTTSFQVAKGECVAAPWSSQLQFLFNEEIFKPKRTGV